MQCNGKSLLPLSTLPTRRSSSLQWRKADCSSDHKGRSLLYRHSGVRGWFAGVLVNLFADDRAAAAVWLSAR